MQTGLRNEQEAGTKSVEYNFKGATGAGVVAQQVNPLPEAMVLVPAAALPTQPPVYELQKQSRMAQVCGSLHPLGDQEEAPGTASIWAVNHGRKISQPLSLFLLICFSNKNYYFLKQTY